MLWKPLEEIQGRKSKEDKMLLLTSATLKGDKYHLLGFFNAETIEKYINRNSSLSVGHSESRRMTDELGSRQRDLSTSSVTKRANGHWHAIIASSCRWSQREYKRQPVHRINHPFASEPSGGVSLLLFLTLRVRSFTSAGVTAQQRWSRSHGRTTVREDSHTGVCGGQLPCVLQQ